MCIEHIFFFKFPIGWDELGVIATVLAVGVALYANRKATKQLKSALKMQEQSKNVGLYKERIELMQAIQSTENVFEPSLKILFNGEIYNHYKVWKNHLSEKESAEQDEQLFFLENMDATYKNDVQDTIERYKAAMSRPDCPQQIIDEYIAYCDSHITWLKTGESEEMIPYNHAEISNRISEAISNAKKEQDLTLRLIEKFIADSIREIQGKKWWKRCWEWIKSKCSRKKGESKHGNN